ncbi:hypothetical protein [Terriglobus sp.]|uniref:hypothetical protein n=1 Tax=Terriglobus sp. TaxID=1889013 RepID=UPI003B003925
MMNEAHADDKTDVIFSCDNTVGRAYGRAFRDLLAKSPRYHELSDTAENRKKAVNVGVVSIEEKAGGDSVGAAAFASVFLLDSVYLDHVVQSCGVNKSEKCAQDLFDSLDEDVDALKKALAEK